VEPNNAITQANGAPNNYFTGTLVNENDIDLFAFDAMVGDVIFLSLDRSPVRVACSSNLGQQLAAHLKLLDAAGEVLCNAEAFDDGAPAINMTCVPNDLTATVPRFPAQALVYTAPYTGRYYANLYYGLNGIVSAPYLFSISLNCQTGHGLPVQLSSFRARATSSSSVFLEWTTVSEINNYGFEVQRRRASHAEFITVQNSFVPGHGTTLEPQHYSYTDTTVTPGSWQYRLKQIDLDGTVHYGTEVSVVVLTGVHESNLPLVFALHQNYPNPFNPSTRIEYDLASAASVTLKVYDVLGREVTTLVDGMENVGFKSVEFDASKLSSGIYFYRLQAGAFVETKRLTVLR
jgi:hypothetical protein